jgi:glycosyltransferase involved in cell wall biosynthesis
MSDFKILLLWDRMGDYHRARWEALKDVVGEANCFAADLGAGDGLYKWENTASSAGYFQLSDRPVEQVPPTEAFNTFKNIVKKNRITHVAIPGYGRSVYRRMLVWCGWHGIQVILFAESWYPGNLFTDSLKGWFVRRTAQAVMASGKRAADHFEKRLQFPKQKIIEGYSVVDNTHFASSITTVKQTPPQLLCVARFAPEKNLRLLIEAYQASTLSANWQLRIVGGGPLKSELESLSKGYNIKLDNWLIYGDLPQMYSQASCFILPSNFEPWGLVVNEAMAAGLPVILSDAVGALSDLLSEEENGWHFDHQSKASLIETLNQLNETNPGQLKLMGERSAEKISHYSPQTWALALSKWMTGNT